MEDDDRRSQTLRNCRLVFALVCCAFAWVALLTYASADWPNPAVWPHPDPVRNACGRAGAWFAYQMLYYLGEGLYPLLFLSTIGAVLRLMRRQIRDWPLKLTGTLLLVAVTAAAAALIDPEASEGLVEGRGGIL
ncbi:MAG: DNA translocase FtsK 4TM domain-containing protein, partial [Phycisphaerae bacterium]